MTDDLRDALTDIGGVGESRADEIMALLESHETSSDLDGVGEKLDEALAYAEAGRPDYAMKFVRQARDAL